METNDKLPHEKASESTENKDTYTDKPTDEATDKKKKGGIHNNALYAASMGRPATAQVDPHSNRGYADTGTNISYEGPTAPGGGGSVGSGYASGKSAIEANIATDSDFDRARVEKDNREETDSDKKSGSGENAKHDEERDII